MNYSDYYSDVDWETILSDWPDDFTDKFLEKYKNEASIIPDCTDDSFKKFQVSERKW
jgi:hypothetical protein